MLSEAEISKLAETDNVIDIKAPTSAPQAEETESQRQARLDREAKAEIESLPFDAAHMIEASRKQHEKRLPEFIKSTEGSIRESVLYAHPHCDMTTTGFPRPIVDAVVTHLTERHFNVSRTDGGFRVDLLG